MKTNPYTANKEVLDIPEYSTDAYMSFQIIFEEFADILIYIEDTSNVFIYEVIFNRLLDNKIRFENILPTGGKQQLIEIHRKINQNKGKILCLFIADMDFDVLLNKQQVNDSNFLYLKRYSIENYLIDHLSGASFVNGRSDLGLENCKQRINYQKWIIDLQIGYRQLLILFGVIQELALGLPNTSMKAEHFILNDSWQLDRNKILQYYNLVKDNLKLKNNIHWKKAVKKINGNLNRYYNSSSWRVIPGKQLLRIFQRYLFEYTDKYHISEKDFINILVANCDLSEFSYIKETIYELLSEQTSSRNATA